MSGLFVSLSNCSHLTSKFANGTENLLGSLSGWLLYPIDISGKKAPDSFKVYHESAL